MTKEKPYVLITGATSGIGFSLAEIFAKNGYPLVLVSRNQQKLIKSSTKLCEAFNVDVATIEQDLIAEEAAYNVFTKTQELDLDIGILINNAGFNEAGLFTDTDLKKENNLIRIHISVVMELTKLFAPEMIKSGFGRIVNLGSTGSFMPVPNNAVYCCSKAFIKNFSNAIRHELRNTGVKVTTLCPGATQTSFHLEAEMSDLWLFKIFPMKPQRVALIGYKKILKGKKTIIPGLYNKFIALSPRITPSWVLNRMTDWLYSLPGGKSNRKSDKRA